MVESEIQSAREGEAGKAAQSDASPRWLELLKVVAMPLVTLIVGFGINWSLDSRQTRENNARVYADVMGRREEADSALRKDMFKSILDTFLQKDPKMPSEQYLDQQVLDLELLAYNFHESLDLGPLFKYVRRHIPDEGNGPNADKLRRLERVAGEVNDRQITALSDSGTVLYGDTELDKVRAGMTSVMFSGSYIVTGKDPKTEQGAPRLCLPLNPADGESHYRQFKLEIIDYDERSREVEARLYVSRPLNISDCNRADLDLVNNREIDTTFWVGLFAFPMIDNTHLTHGERCAVSLRMMTPDIANLALSYFPGSRASLKDKPYYDELMHDLLHQESRSGNSEH